MVPTKQMKTITLLTITSPEVEAYKWEMQDCRLERLCGDRIEHLKGIINEDFDFHFVEMIRIFQKSMKNGNIRKRAGRVEREVDVF